MSSEQEFIVHDFNLPCYDNELSKAEEIIGNLKQKINKYVTTVVLISDKEFVRVYEEIVRVLDYVGRLSMPAFAIEDELEEMYKMYYLRAPELGKKLWSDHYESIHRPYNTLKNRCFKLLEELDEYYIALYDKKPPNWNP